jgi:hypothetical protein
MHRRDFIGKASLAAAALGASSLSAQTSSTKTMSYTLAPLPYPHAALEPHIDQATMEIHHGKHHNAYVTNVNAALAKEAAAHAAAALGRFGWHRRGLGGFCAMPLCSGGSCISLWCCLC